MARQNPPLNPEDAVHYMPGKSRRQRLIVSSRRQNAANLDERMALSEVCVRFAVVKKKDHPVRRKIVFKVK